MKMLVVATFIFFLQLGAVAGASNCQLLTYYKGSQFRPNRARVHIGFLPQIKKINSYAVECNVEVYITSSYRPTSKVNGAIVTPATRSNHMIGHAIDMNLVTKTKFCNSRCLLREDRPKGAQCFINKIRSDNVLRWGGDFTTRDPVHIDDGTNRRNPVRWDQLFNSIQNNCQ